MNKVFIGMETSGVLRTRFQNRGWYAISVDRLPAEDGCGLQGDRGGHWQGNVFDVFSLLTDEQGMMFDLAIFHPDCTFHAVSAAWAFTDGPYHQKVKPETLVGARRRLARRNAELDVERIKGLPVLKVIENPRGTLPTRTSLGRAHQVMQPNEFGEDASKATCLWFFDCEGRPANIQIPLGRKVAGRMVEWPRGSGRMVERWSNQTDSGQNRLSPSDQRWVERSRTYPGIADAVVGYFDRIFRATAEAAE